jgi:hypothetical protein
LICPTPSVICLPYYLRFLTLFVVILGGWLGSLKVDGGLHSYLFLDYWFLRDYLNEIGFGRNVL